MTLANEIWKLARDVLLVLTGIFLTTALVLGLVPTIIAPSLVPLTFLLFALPSWLRSDERKNGKDRGQDDSPPNGDRGHSEDDR